MATSELLKQIQAGKKLKKADTSDRSAPMIEAKSSGSRTGLRTPASAPAIPPGAGPPQLGSLFGSGVPKLRPPGQGSLAKAPTLGRPPAVPGRAVPSPATSVPPPPSRVAPPKPSTPAPPIPPAPALPTRAAPALPSRVPTIPARAPPPPARATPSPPLAVSSPSRRPPPPPRTVSPPAPPRAPPPPIRPPLSVAIRTSPADIAPLARAVPPLVRSNNAIPALPARKAPPPPPARPSSVGGSPHSRAGPPPPVRKVPVVDRPPVLPPHVKALSEAESSAAPPSSQSPAARMSFVSPAVAPPSSSHRPRVISASSRSESSSRPSTTLSDRQVNGTRRSAPTRKIPTPLPEAGSHRFPTSDFPPPREFTPEARLYGGGRQRGSNFDLSNI